MITLRCPVCDKADQYDDFARYCVYCRAYISRRLALIDQAEKLCSDLEHLYHTGQRVYEMSYRKQIVVVGYTQERVAHVMERAIARLTRRLGNDDFVGYDDNPHSVYTGSTVRL